MAGMVTTSTMMSTGMDITITIIMMDMAMITTTVTRTTRDSAAMRTLFAVVLAALFATPASAQVAEECDWVASARAIVEPWEANTKTFSNGKVRLALLDTVEPAAGALHILVLSPPFGETGERQCRVISMSKGIGFAGIDFKQLDASYDPSTGLTFSVPGSVAYDGPGPVPKIIVFTVNQATGDIAVDLD